MHKFLISRRIVLAACLGFLALLATGCSPAQAIVGKWDVDVSKGVSGDLTKANPGLAARMLFATPQVQLTFEGNGTYQVSASFLGQKNDVSGSWRYVKMDGKTMVLMVKQAGKTDESELRMTLTPDNDHAEISVPMEVAGQAMKPSLNFVRVKPK